MKRWLERATRLIFCLIQRESVLFQKEGYMYQNGLSDLFRKHVDECLSHLSRGTPLAERQEIINLLERCVAHKLLLKMYLRKLQSILHGETQYNGVTTVVRAKELMNDSLSQLSDDELTQLALDPVSLWTLHDLIDETMPDQWIDRVIEADKQWEQSQGSEKDLSPNIEGFPWADLHMVSRDSLKKMLMEE